MIEKIIEFFARRHLLTNFFAISVVAGGIFAWNNTNKEELPAVTFDFVRISVRYPGAPASDVEYFVTKPIEEKVRGLDGVYRVRSTSSVGQSNVTVELEQNYPNTDEAVTEIRNAVMDVRYPDEVLDDPSVRVFKTTKKAVLDIAIYRTDTDILNESQRQELQQVALALENQLLSLSAVNSISRRGYLQEEIQIKVDPRKLLRYEIPFNTAMREIRDNHVRRPAGTLEAEKEPKVTIYSMLDTPEKISEVVIQGGFSGRSIPLKEVADVTVGFEKPETVYKVNGHEAIMFNVVKNTSVGILVTLDDVTKTVERFRKNNLEGTVYRAVFLDDESIDVRNRLDIVTWNGLIGFFLILLMLFIFLNKRSGFWVAMGIPFTVCFTMIVAAMMGYTINGITLAAVIIVMGMIVDDAIVVAENITRLHHKGMKHSDAVIKGTSSVLLPIIASITTTCIAFIPLFFFSGRFGRVLEFIPPIVIIMLVASLIESIIILPGHMDLPIPFVDKFRKKKVIDGEAQSHWFDGWEDKYGRFLERILPYRWVILICAILFMFGAEWYASEKMKFVMFPNEETRDLVLTGKAPKGSTRYETAKMVTKIEETIAPYIGSEVVGFRTTIAQSRRGGAVEENKFSILIEIVPKEKRKKSADLLVKEFEEKIAEFKEFTDLKFAKSRWGQDSGSPIEIIIQQNNDKVRHDVAVMLADKLKSHEALKNIEVEEGLRVPEYRVQINQEKIKRLSISPADVASTFRAALEGSVLYEFSNGDEDVNVRFTVKDHAKKDIESVLSLPVENRGNYLVPLRNIVSVEKVVSPNSIDRLDLKRTSRVYSDIELNGKMTPLEIAADLEENIFPEILSKYPTTALSFGGEIQDTRESTGDFKSAIIMVVMLIYIVLAILFNSLTKPFVIMLAIPFGVLGIILAFWVHGKMLYGFFAVVGALGMAGVVINDSIIMLVKLDQEYDPETGKDLANQRIAQTAQTRLRAVILTTLTTVAGLLPTAYAWAGYDAMLAEMMLSMSWGLLFGSLITLILIPCIYRIEMDILGKFKRKGNLE